MKLTRALRTVLVFFIIAGICSTLFVGYKRFQAEEANKSLDLLLDSAQLKLLSQKTGRSIDEVLTDFKDKGATAVLIKEDTLADLEGRVLAFKGKLGLIPFLGNDHPFLQNGFDNLTYLITSEEDLANRIVYQLNAKGGVANVTYLEKENLWLIGTNFELKGGTGSLALLEQGIEIGLGFDPQLIDICSALGYQVIPQLRSWPQADAESISKVIAPLGELNISALAFNDRELPGYPENIQFLADEIDKISVPIVAIEFMEQNGFSQLAYLLDKEVLRLHSISENEMKTLSVKDAIDRYTLASSERNIRLLLVRFYLNVSDEELLDYNAVYLEQLKTELTQSGFNLGGANPFSDFSYPLGAAFLMGLAVIAAFMLVMERLGLLRWGFILSFLALFLWLVLILWQPVLGRKLMALTSALIFPSLAVMWVKEKKSGNLGQTIFFFLITSAISLVGGLMVMGLLSDVSFMLRLNQFLGTKVAHVLPLVFLAFVFYFWQEKDRGLERLKTTWALPLTWGTVIVSVIIIAAGAYYVLRTGNEGASATTLEIYFRQFLRDVLAVRPRTKEFLIGHPLLLLSIYLGYNKRYLLLWVGGAIGQVSLINTLAHIHTPLIFSFTRIFHGLWLGIIVGIVFILIWRFLQKLDHRYLQCGWFDA